jgi:hypothetical protein
LLADRIEALGVGKWFDVGATSITCANGSEFIFEGLYANITKLVGNHHSAGGLNPARGAA